MKTPLPRRRFLGAASLLLATPFRRLQAGDPHPPILIGQTVVESGPLASLSRQPLQGIRALVESVNAQGGIHERKLEILRADDAYDADKAAANVRRFADKGALAILMPIGTTPSVGALKAANELRIPLVGPYSGARPVARFSPYGFSLRISFEDEYRRLIEHMLPLGVNRIAFVHNDNPGARGAMEASRDILAQKGVSLLGSAAIRQDGGDAAERAAEIARLTPDAVLMCVTTEVASRFISSYKAAGGSSSFYSFSFLNGSVPLRDIGEGANGVVISQVVPFPWNTALPIVRDYQQAMRSAGIDELSHASLEGYIAARVLVEGLRRTPAKQLQPDSLKATLESMNRVDLGGFTLRFSKTLHAGSDFSELNLLRRDGRFVK
ncbi:ABC transporter substrate-binding protein [Zoogloea sp.]|uniref:ABC transporter substrate-binding protein n=1 Tax=Zoogloea sp. TaxID=49181 RepID=UPI001416885B|nr:MAG: ABC transporter substrate-binding protein [Zoogloea sp.]